MLKFFELHHWWMSNPRPPSSLVESFLDAEATVTDSIPPIGKGKIRIFGSYWPAKVDTVTKWEIPVGARVIVQRREGIVLVVRPLSVRLPQSAELSPPAALSTPFRPAA